MLAVGDGVQDERQCLQSTIVMLVKSVHTTRLETRAKEFHYCASRKVSQTFMRNESEGVSGTLRCDAATQQHRPIWILR